MKNKGFTLFELLVSLTMFFVIMIMLTVGIGFFIHLVDNSKSKQTTEITQPKDSIKELPMRSEKSEDSL